MKYSSRSSGSSTSPYILAAIHYGYDSKAVHQMPVCTLYSVAFEQQKEREKNATTEHSTEKPEIKRRQIESKRNGLCVRCVCVLYVILPLEK